MKKRTNEYERNLKEIYDAVDMIEKESQCSGDARYKKLMGEHLLFVRFLLKSVSLALYAILGFKISEFLSRYF